MKVNIKLMSLCLIALALVACAGGGAVQVQRPAKLLQPENSLDSLNLDAAIAEAAAYFVQRLPKGAKVALVHFDAPSGRLSDYVFEEIWGRIEDSGKFIMVDRRNLDRINTEINYQLGSGRVYDDFLVSITRQYGAEVLVYGQVVALGGEFRMTVYATDVESASSSQRAYNVRPDNRLASLLNVTLDDEIERAVSVMARAVDQRTTIAVGRISYVNTDTVSGFSTWLKNSIITSAQRHRDKLQVASESESADFAVLTRGFIVGTLDSDIQAIVTGSYSPLDMGAEVSLHLISTAGNKAVLASSRFAVPASELERRGLSLLPENGGAVVTQAEFEAKQQAISPYEGKNNRWDFTITPDTLTGVYREGDYMTMRLYSAQDCYFRIVHVDVNGNTQVIYPITPRDNNFIRAGETRRIPDNTRYRMDQPFGEEMILVAAYDRPFLINTQSDSAPLSAEIITRSLTAESDNHATMSPTVTARFSYTILPRE